MEGASLTVAWLTLVIDPPVALAAVPIESEIRGRGHERHNLYWRNEENKTETTALSKPNIREPNYLYHWSSTRGNSGSLMLASLRKNTWHDSFVRKPNKLFSGGLLWLSEQNQTSFSKEACCNCAVTECEKPNNLFSGGLLCLCCDQVRKIKQAF